MKLQLDAFELEMRPLVRDTDVPLSDRLRCWDEIRGKAVEEFEQVSKILVGKEGSTSVDVSLNAKGEGKVLLRYAKTL